jgi:hypothetical protein
MLIAAVDDRRQRMRAHPCPVPAVQQQPAQSAITSTWQGPGSSTCKRPGLPMSLATYVCTHAASTGVASAGPPHTVLVR